MSRFRNKRRKQNDTEAAKSRISSENQTTFTNAFSTFSVSDVQKAKKFYGETLGIDVKKEEEGLRLEFEAGQVVFLYPKDDHKPATFTVLNLPVDNIALAVDDLAARGIKFEKYGGEIGTDEKGIFWGKKDGHGPNIAWFKDPDGNILSVIESR
ncbi:MAG: VOC family protein [Acidobacteria bacterium]|nr:VOC family protein [Acidobacteriota bacterium]